MADVFTKKKRSEIMSRIRSKNTSPEVLLFKLLRKSGYKFSKHVDSLPGKPDAIIQKERIAIFVDGEFWHGYQFKRWESRIPKKYWLEKIKRNIRNDRKNRRALREAGWSVLKVWSRKFRSNPEYFMKRLLVKVRGSRKR